MSDVLSALLMIFFAMIGCAFFLLFLVATFLARYAAGGRRAKALASVLREMADDLEGIRSSS